MVSCWQEEARREADDAHRAFAAYEGDLPTLLRVYEAFRKVGRGRPACAQRATQSPRTEAESPPAKGGALLFGRNQGTNKGTFPKHVAVFFRAVLRVDGVVRGVPAAAFEAKPSCCKQQHLQRLPLRLAWPFCSEPQQLPGGWILLCRAFVVPTPQGHAVITLIIPARCWFLCFLWRGRSGRTPPGVGGIS